MNTNDLTVCPRCSAPVRGQFRYCPECACRLPGHRTPTAPAPDHPHRYWGATLVGLALAGIVGLILMTGLGLFGTQARETSRPTPPTPAPAAAVVPLRLADLNEAFESVSGGLALYVPLETPHALDPERRLQQALADPQPKGPWLDRMVEAFLRPIPRNAQPAPVHTRSFLLMRYEVTRGQWAEFLDEAERALSRLERTTWIRALWLPRTGTERQASQRYVDAWLDAATQTLSPDAAKKARTALQRPLTLRARLLLLAPPAWVAVSRNGELDWRMPAGTSNFPVSGISGIDAEIFVVWARPAVRLPGLRLPSAAEYRRAFHQGKPPALSGAPGAWPWGDAWRPLHFNNRRYQRHTGQSGPIDVFGPKVLGEVRPNERAILGLVGNVAEWVLPDTLTRRGNRYDASDGTSAGRRTLQVAGGSFQDDPDTCRHILWPAHERERRLGHVGFRLAMPKSSMFGGR